MAIDRDGMGEREGGRKRGNERKNKLLIKYPTWFSNNEYHVVHVPNNVRNQVNPLGSTDVWEV